MKTDSEIVGDGDMQVGGRQSVASHICGSCFEIRFPGPPLVFPASGDTDSMKAPNFAQCLWVSVEGWRV